MRLPIIFAVSLALCVSSYAASTPSITVDEAIRRHLLVNFVRPTYPDEAKRRFWTGRGVFELTFDYESGHVREIHVVKSTGHGILDAAVIVALKLWKAKPRSLHTLRAFPIEFTYTHG